MGSRIEWTSWYTSFTILLHQMLTYREEEWGKVITHNLIIFKTWNCESLYLIAQTFVIEGDWCWLKVIRKKSPSDLRNGPGQTAKSWSRCLETPGMKLPTRQRESILSGPRHLSSVLRWFLSPGWVSLQPGQREKNKNRRKEMNMLKRFSILKRHLYWQVSSSPPLAGRRVEREKKIQFPSSF